MLFIHSSYSFYYEQYGSQWFRSLFLFIIYSIMVSKLVLCLKHLHLFTDKFACGAFSHNF